MPEPGPGWTRDYEATEKIRDMMEGPGRCRVEGVYLHEDGRLALVTRDNIGLTTPDWRWHISVRQTTAGGSIPTWNEVANTAHDLRPGVGFVLSVPPRSMWMSVHDHVLHLEEVKDHNLQQQWIANRGEGRVR
jgi:hypothetical protein